MIGCIILASGLSARYGKNKLLELLDGEEVILHTVRCARQAGEDPLVVTRSEQVKALMDNRGIKCVLHEKPLKSDTMHIGMENLIGNPEGYLFWPGDQPLVLHASIQKMTAQFYSEPDTAVRLCFGDTPGSPVLFPVSMREDLLAYHGDRGGSDVLKKSEKSWKAVQAQYEWELWDVDTPERMELVRLVYKKNTHHVE